MQALREVYTLLKSDQQLKETIEFIEEKCKNCKNTTPQEFVISEEHTLINLKLAELRLEKL